MGVAYNAGANLRDNAKQLNFGQIVGDAARNALGDAARAVLPIAPVIPHIAQGMQDFFHGLATGHALGQSQAAAAPAAKAPSGGGVKAPVYSPEFLAAQPNFVQQLAGQSAAAAAATKSSKSDKPTNPFDEAVARFATADGGVSLNELGALSRSAAETSMLRTQPKDPSAKDVAGLQLKDMADQLYTGKLAQAQALKAKDPDAAAKLQEDAVKERMDTLKAILGANPVDLQTAAAMGGGGQ